MVRTNRGLVVQEPSTGKFRLLCAEAFESTVTETVPFAVARDGTLLVGSYEGGLQHSSPDWCSFEDVTDVPDVYTADIQSNPQDLDDLFAVALPLDGRTPGLFNRRGASSTWRSIATMEGAPNSVRVASTNPNRVYVVSMRSEGEQQIADVLTSTNRGESFTTSSLPLEPEEIRAYLLEAGQGDEEKVFMRTQTADGLVPERLLLSENGGRTFRETLRAQGPLALAFGADPSTVWVGGFEGLFRSTDGGVSFTRVERSPERIGCLAVRDGKLYVCGYAENEFGVLASGDPATQAFAWFLRFPDVRVRLSCGAGSDEALACQYPFEDWAAEQLEPSSPTGQGSGGSGGAVAAQPAGSAGTGSPATASSPAASQPSDSASCSFGAPRGWAAHAGVSTWVMLLVLGARRRRHGSGEPSRPRALPSSHFRWRTTHIGSARSLELWMHERARPVAE